MAKLPCFSDAQALRIIRRLCADNNLDTLLLEGLCEIVQEHSGSGRADGVNEQIAQVIERFISRSDSGE